VKRPSCVVAGLAWLASAACSVDDSGELANPRVVRPSNQPGGSGSGGGGGGGGSTTDGGSGGSGGGGSGGAPAPVGTGGSSPDAAPPAPDAAPPAVPPPAPDAAPPAPAFAVTGVATWRGGVDAAYTLIHDAVCDTAAEGGLAHADPELTKRGLHAGFGVIVGECDAAEWPKVKDLLAHGHDVFNHSWSHRCLGTARDCGNLGAATTDFSVEIDQAGTVLEMNLGAPVQYFTFPFDVCGADAVAHLKSRGYLGARCGDRGVTAATFTDGFANRFDVWGPSFSVYYNGGPCQGLIVANSNMAPESLPAACRAYVLTQYVEDAIKQKGWAIRSLNGFAGDRGAFQPIALADYTAHLDYVRSRTDAGQLWTAGPATVIKYRFARERCAPPAAAANVLRFPAPSADCQKYATTLTYFITTPDDRAALHVTQAGATTTARKLSPSHFAVDANPTAGDATLTP
jgi:peptidoglycan/xylan/chitin deacetylase (PgdA/CDA1 family)